MHKVNTISDVRSNMIMKFVSLIYMVYFKISCDCQEVIKNVKSDKFQCCVFGHCSNKYFVPKCEISYISTLLYFNE